MASVIDRHSITATIDPLAIELAVIEGSLSLDESRAPYAEMQLVAAFPSDSNLELIDITAQPLRISGEIRQDFGIIWSLATLTALGGGSVSVITDFGGVSPSSITNRLFGSWNPRPRASQVRPYDLYITERSIDANKRQLTIRASSDESRMISDTLVAGTSYDPASTDIATIVQLVLDRYDADLEPGYSTGTVAEADATIWEPGHKAWDYLDDFLEAASLRVWADETAKWYLTPRQTISPGSLNVTPTNTMITHVDTMTYNPTFFYDAVVIEYRWVDALNVNQVAYDFAGNTVPRAALSLRRNDTVFPGAGAAQGILDRMEGRGRVIDVDAVSRYTATPGQAVTITPPTGFDQKGFLVSVEWSLPAAQMTIVSRNLTTNPVTSWLSPLLALFSVSDLTDIGGNAVANLTAIPGDDLTAITDALQDTSTGVEWDEVSVGVVWDTFLQP
jgi:hypothetical protein